MYFSVVLIVIAVLFGSASSLNNAYSNCAEVGTQRHVSIDQLMGLWYGIELISHKPESSIEPQHPDTCLQINISEEPNSREEETRYYNDRQNYDANNYNNKYNNYNTITTTTNPFDRRRKTPYGRENSFTVINEIEQRRLKVLWIGTDGSLVAYWTSYMAAPGVWHITGPHNGSSLIETIDNFSGTIQVLKAVGDHMVLTFCHIRPDHKLYTVVLSRLPEMKRRDILAIHNMLTVRGLNIVNVRDVCPVAGANVLSLNIFVGIICYICSLLLW